MKAAMLLFFFFLFFFFFSFLSLDLSAGLDEESI